MDFMAQILLLHILIASLAGWMNRHQLVSERDVLEGQLRAVLDGELKQVDEEGELGHPQMIVGRRATRRPTPFALPCLKTRDGGPGGAA
jgi:hypothetical protein